MKIGVIKEIKDKENRVGLTPTGAVTLAKAGHDVLVQQGAGLGSGFSDREYALAGAELVKVDEAWHADLVVKVKEPLESEYCYLTCQVVFTYFHLAGVTRALTEALLETKTTAVAYETVEDEKGKLPLLAPMSAIAGNMAVTIGNYYLARFNQGKGVLLSAIFGSPNGKVVIIGDGTVGRHAARVATGIGSNVFICGRHPERAHQIKRAVAATVDFFVSQPEHIAEQLMDADLVVGAVLHRGGKAPFLVSEEMVKQMQPGSVIVDVSIDQGGCVETSRPTSHSEPVFEKHGVIHYCVTNMPGAYPRTSTIALTAATLPYTVKLADKGIQALVEDSGFAKGINTYQGYLTSRPVAESLGLMRGFREFTAFLG